MRPDGGPSDRPSAGPRLYFPEPGPAYTEATLEAADAGPLAVAEPCLSIGGTGRGADTALVLRPSHAQTFFDLRIMEIAAKPRFG